MAAQKLEIRTRDLGTVIFGPIHNNEWAPYTVPMQILEVFLDGFDICAKASWAPGLCPVPVLAKGWYHYTVLSPQGDLVWAARLDWQEDVEVPVDKEPVLVVKVSVPNETVQQAFEAERRRIKETREFYARQHADPADAAHGRSGGQP